MVVAGAIWIMEGHSVQDNDCSRKSPETFILPGIYCSDEETRDNFIENFDLTKIESSLDDIRKTIPLFGVDGVIAHVATEAQIAFFVSREALADEEPMVVYWNT